MSSDDTKKSPLAEKQGADGEDTVSPRDARIAEIREAERINELRERLYARGDAPRESSRHSLPKREIHDVVTPPKHAPSINPTPIIAQPPARPEGVAAPSVEYTETMPQQTKKYSYRKIMLLFGLIFFVGALAVSSLLMFSGSTVSGDNIDIAIDGPITVGGGEEAQFQVSIVNQNTVAIQSATLVVEYPEGTLSALDGDRELSTERQTLNEIAPGDLVNVPLRARLFGKENEEREIHAWIEYRVAGSNATYEKKADPLILKISTSPVLMSIDMVKAITSGQELTLTYTIQSNSPSPLTDLLVKAVYPDGFDFSSAKPEPVSGEDIWKFAELKPGEKKTITVKGLITGYENETRRFSASAGVANENDAYVLASPLANTSNEVAIEQAFLSVGVTINSSPEETVVVNVGDAVNVRVEFENALDSTIYNGKIFVQLDGNALDEFSVESGDGFYNSSNNTISWDGVAVSALREILPGRSQYVTFQLKPKVDIGKAPEVKLSVTIEGERGEGASASEKLVGTVARTVRIESIPTMTATALFTSGPFTNTGPTPPVAEKVTQYTLTLKVKSGSNDVTDGEVTAVLPSTYMSWLDLVTEGDDVTFNSTTRTIKWSIGDMESNTEEEVSFQVAFKPSLSQVGTTPTILEAQRLKATDRFTGTIVRTSHPALTTSLFSESDEQYKNGRVRASE